MIQLLENKDNVYQISDFSFHSIGLHLFNKNKKDLFIRFAQDMFRPGGLRITSLAPDYIPLVVEASKKYGLDFDDAYQYAIAKSQNCILVTYNKDFDNTPEKRTTPEDLM